VWMLVECVGAPSMWVLVERVGACGMYVSVLVEYVGA